MADQNLVSIGVFLIVAGIIAGLLAIMLPLTKQGRVRAGGGGVILIGPFPIVFGSDRETVRGLLVLAIILVALLIGFYLIQLIP